MKNNELKADHARFKAVIKEAESLRWRKLNDYGASYRNFGPLGVVVRMDDKMGRIKSLLKRPGNFEGLRDSAIDLANYAIMLAMELEVDNVHGKVSNRTSDYHGKTDRNKQKDRHQDKAAFRP